MGYTHYWTPKKATPKQWDELLKEAKQLLEALPANTDSAGGYSSDEPLEIKGGMGDGEPTFNKNMICFNGNEEKGLDHETFLIEADIAKWSFCKTARKPYDLLVCAILIGAHNVLGYEVRSDGSLEDWKPAIEFYMKTIFDVDNMKAKRKIVLLKDILPEFLIEEWNENGKLELNI